MLVCYPPIVLLKYLIKYIAYITMCLVAQSFQTLCDPMDSSPAGSSVHGILQARILEWVVIPSSRDLPSLGIKPRSPALQVGYFPSESAGKPNVSIGWLFY